MKRVFGLLILVLGLVGIVGCLGGMVGIWIVAEKTQAISTEILVGARDVVGVIQDNTAQADKAVGKTRLEVQLAGVLANQYAKSPTNNNKTQAELTDKEKAIDENFATVQSQAEKLSITAKTLATALDDITALPATGSKETPDEKAWIPVIKALQDASSLLRDASEDLNQLKQFISGLRNGGEEAKQSAKGLATLATTTGEKLDSVRTKIQNFETKLNELEGDIEAWQRDVPQWILTTKFVVLGVLFWMAVGQACIVSRGWSMFRNPVRTTPEGDTTPPG
ncbi:MAG: hypothetical protein ACFCD0_28445 [Gemmataceae bacterium]